MKFIFVVFIILLVLSIPLGGLEILSGGKFSMFSKSVRPRLVSVGHTIWCFLMNSRFAFLFGALLWFLSPVVWVVGAVVTYVVLFCQLWTADWGKAERKAKLRLNRQTVLAFGGTVVPDEPTGGIDYRPPGKHDETLARLEGETDD
jgi:hypothetical protein